MREKKSVHCFWKTAQKEENKLTGQINALVSFKSVEIIEFFLVLVLAWVDL